MDEPGNTTEAAPRLHGSLSKIIVTPKAVFLVIQHDGQDIYVPLNSQQLLDIPQALAEATTAHASFRAEEKMPAFLH